MGMHVHIGSVNLAKQAAVKAAFRNLRRNRETAPFLQRFSPIKYCVPRGVVESGVPENPEGFQETIRGAYNRAKSALAERSPGQHECMGVGIESGFFSFRLFNPELDAIANFDVCCLMTPELTVYGFSPGMEYPFLPVQRILRGGDFNTEMAAHLGQMQSSPQTGFLGLLTDNQYTRQRVSEIAVELALLRLSHNEFY